MKSFFWACLALFFSLAPTYTETPPQPVAFRVGPLLFERPAGWKWVKPEGSFRAAQLEKSGPHQTSIVMAFSRFPTGTGGTVQANVDRWIQQFSQTSTPPVIQNQTEKSCPLTMVKIRGILKGDLPGGPKQPLPDALLLGAILEADGELIVAKLAGPASLVSPEERVFSAMISAAIEKKP